MNNQPHPLASDPLAQMAFEKVRRLGVVRSEGETVIHEGMKYVMSVQTIGTIKTEYVLLQPLECNADHAIRALAIVQSHDRGYPGGPGGLELVLPALHSGVFVPGNPHTGRDYRVLTSLPIPGSCGASGHDC